MLLSYQAVVEDLFYNAQRPDRVGSGHRVNNPDPVPSLGCSLARFRSDITVTCGQHGVPCEVKW